MTTPTASASSSAKARAEVPWTRRAGPPLFAAASGGSRPGAIPLGFPLSGSVAPPHVDGGLPHAYTKVAPSRSVK